MTNLPPRIRLVILFGGRSAEHEISCISASHVLAAVDPSRYDVVPVGITREGRFVLSDATLSGSGRELSAEGPVVDPLPALLGHPEAGVARPSPELDPRTPDGPSGAHIPTVVLPILHGPNGEDGTVQGMLELAGLPYVGSGVLASSLAMDKVMAKTVLDALGVHQVRWRSVAHHEAFVESDAAKALVELGPIVFVKPANMGSSIGVSRITEADGTQGLLEAVKDAFRYDDLVVLEQGVEGRELECGVLGNDEPRASVLGEVVTDAEFYDYGDKYFDGTATTIVPAELDPATAATARELAVRTFTALRCAGMARVDLFLTENGQLLVNEVNTIPGFTPISMYPKLWEATGLPYSELIDELVGLALEAHRRRSSRTLSPS